LVDIGAGYGTFCSEFINAHKGYSEVYAIEPSPDMAKACLDKGLNVINKPLEAVERWELPSSECRIFTCFELLEHLVDPGRFLTALRGIMKRNDILILSSLSSTGFDIQILWEKSRNVFAPHHLNFFNPDSSALLIERHGFRLLEISTPGRLDIDIVNNSSGLLKEKKFWSYFLNKISKKGKASLQRLLQQANLSSHMVVIAQRI
jgi:SAM-dependent methyltransferase